MAAGAVLVGRQRIKADVERHRLKHVSQTEESYRCASTRILILGAGFGGLATALKLDELLGNEDDVSLLVVDRDNDMLFTPLLWTAANGRTNPNDVVVPVRNFQKHRQFHHLHAEIEGIDLDRKEVSTFGGIRPYDLLVIALGSHTAVPDLPGLRKYALPFHRPSDALELRNHLIDAIEAAHQSGDPREKKAWLTFVVGGAGDTGVELAAIIHDYLVTGIFNAYPWVADAPVRIFLIGRSERILPTSKPKTSRLAHKVLEQEGVEVLTGRSITGVTETAVETSEEVIEARTLFWAAGTTPPDVVRELPVEHGPNGAILVDDHLRVLRHPDVYAIGDSAWAYDSISGNPVPATAQAARVQGNYVAKTIAAEYAKKPAPPFRYTTLGHLALLGHYTAVAEVGPFTFDGFLAFVLWHLVYLIRNPSWAKRIRLVIDWFLSAILGREIGQLRLNNDVPQYRRVLEPKT
jgi:NADH dehydrogenase